MKDLLPPHIDPPKYSFGDFQLSFGPPKRHKPYRRAQMKYWSWRIAKSIGLKKPINLFIIDHDQAHTFSDLIDERGFNVSIQAPTLGQYYVRTNNDGHCVIVRLRYTARENLYILAHELTHAAQCEIDYTNDGAKFLDEYQVQQMLRGYLHNRFEMAARKSGIEWVERILKTEPLELDDECGSVLIDKGTRSGRPLQKLDVMNDLIGRRYEELKEPQYIYRGERAKEFTPSFTFGWKSSNEVAKDCLTKEHFSYGANIPFRNLRQPSEDHPYEASQFESAILKVNGRKTQQGDAGRFQLDALLALSQSMGVCQHDGYGHLPGLRCNSP